MAKNTNINIKKNFESTLKKALSTPLPAKKVKKQKNWIGLPLDLNFLSHLFRK